MKKRPERLAGKFTNHSSSMNALENGPRLIYEKCNTTFFDLPLILVLSVRSRGAISVVKKIIIPPPRTHSLDLF
jgi:hypothetical protein